MEKIREVYSLLMPLQGARVVLPRAAVAEVTGYSRPKNRPDDAPDFLLGFVDWHGQQIPLVSFELACGREAPEQGRRARIAIVFGIGGLLEPNAFAVLTQGYPYLVRVNEGVLKQEDLTEADKKGPILARVRMANERPLIPDIESLEKMLAGALGDKARTPEPAVSDSAEDELDQLDLGDEEEFESGFLDEGTTARTAANMAAELESLVEESEQDLASISSVTDDDETDYAGSIETADLDLPDEETASGETDYSGEMAALDEALEDSDEDSADDSTDRSTGEPGDDEFSIETGELGEFDLSEESGETDYSGELNELSGALEETGFGEESSERENSEVESTEDDSSEKDDASDATDGEEEGEEKHEFSLDDIEFDLDDEESPDKED